MTLLRQLVLKLSAAVVFYAPLGSQDWAEAIAREIAHIPSDWLALRWALGSTRVLLYRNPDPNAPAREFITRLRGFNHIFWLLWTFNCTVSLIRATTWTERTGWALADFGWTYWTVSSFFSWLEERSTPPLSDIPAYRLHSRQTLLRRLDRYRTVRRWFPALAAISLCTGYLVTLDNAFPAGLVSHPILACILLGFTAFAIWLQCLDSPAKIQQRLDRLNERIADSLNERS
jgi:hypothetical protein